MTATATGTARATRTPARPRALVEVDLEHRYPAWRVQVVVNYLVGQGLRLAALPHTEGQPGGDDLRYTIVSHPDDAADVRRGLVAADLR